MALDSISKLSVLITGDETPLAAAARRSEAIVSDMSTRIENRWARGMAAMAAMNDKWAAGLARLAEQNAPGPANPLEQIKTGAPEAARGIDAVAASSVKLSTVMSAMRGNIPAIFQVAGKSAGPVAALLAMGTSVYKLAGANDALKASIGTNELETWAGQWQRVKTEASQTLGIIGEPFQKLFREGTQDLANYIRQWKFWLNPDDARVIEERVKWMAQLEQREKAAAKAAEDAAKAKAAQAKAIKDAAIAAERERDARSTELRASFSRAEEIRAMVRTPAEEFKRTVGELRAFFASGFIDQETMDRAMQMAQERMQEASRSKQRTSHEAMQSIAAAERYTMAGYSASLATQKDDKSEEKQLVNQGQQMIQVMQHIDAQLADRPDWPAFQISKLN